MAKKTNAELIEALEAATVEIGTLQKEVNSLVGIIKTKDRAIEDFHERLELANDPDFASQSLQNHGWQPLLDVKIGDCREPNGKRRRTFKNRGRYTAALLFKG